MKLSSIPTLSAFMIILLSIGFAPYLAQDAFADRPTISGWVADDPDDTGNNDFSTGDTLTINFGAATNATINNHVITQTSIDGNYTFSGGTISDGTYTGTWTDTSTFVITIDTAGTTPVISTTTITPQAANTIGLDGEAVPQAGSDHTLDTVASPALTGDFGLFLAVSTNGGGSCGVDCTEPTLGLTSDGTRIVDNGFSYNGQSIDVDYYFTPYPLVTVNVGKQNVAEFKIYENRGPQNIQHFELAFGLANGDSIGMSKAVINWDKSFAGIETITLDDPGNVLDNVRVITSEGSCSDETETKCLIVIVEHTFRAPLDFNILATNVWDTKRNAWQNYYNHGIEVVGESMNPPEIYDGINKGTIYHLTETGKNTAVDEFGNAWTLDKTWKMDYIPKGKIVDGITLHGIDRNNAWFDTYKQEQALLAQELVEQRYLFYSDEKFDEINDIFSYESTKRIDKSSDLETQNKMIFESERGQKIMDQLCSFCSDNEFKEINRIYSVITHKTN